jgi:hypothetical protein
MFRLTQRDVEACWAAQVHLLPRAAEQQLSDDVNVGRLANNLRQQQQQQPAENMHSELLAEVRRHALLLLVAACESDGCQVMERRHSLVGPSRLLNQRSVCQYITAGQQQMRLDINLRLGAKCFSMLKPKC